MTQKHRAAIDEMNAAAEALQVCRERRYPWALTDAELVKDARELLEELDGFNGMEFDSESEVACQRAHGIISALLDRFQPQQPENAMRFFTENVDCWGAAEWFDRLAKAIREQDKAVVAKDDISFETYRMIAASSAMTLVRDHERTVRAALAARSNSTGGSEDE